jgi:molecular chaperone DnaJ
MDPYEVLGVEPGADEETVKKAYRALVRKYHPDKYVNNPLADLAAEKMKEINKAYDMITKGSAASSNTSSQGSSGGGHSHQGYGNYQQSAEASFRMVRMLISMGQYSSAVNMLNSLPKEAEWYYLHGLICVRQGYYDQAVADFTQATNMEPSNTEYRSALESIKNRNTTYANEGSFGASCCSYAPCICVPCMCQGCC